MSQRWALAEVFLLGTVSLRCMARVGRWFFTRLILIPGFAASAGDSEARLRRIGSSLEGGAPANRPGDVA